MKFFRMRTWRGAGDAQGDIFVEPSDGGLEIQPMIWSDGQHTHHPHGPALRLSVEAADALALCLIEAVARVRTAPKPARECCHCGWVTEGESEICGLCSRPFVETEAEDMRRRGS